MKRLIFTLMVTFASVAQGGVIFPVAAVVALNAATISANNSATRSKATVYAFRSKNPCPANNSLHGACPGYVVDHIQALECGGHDVTSNMQWQTVAAGKAKDKLERLCRIKVK